MSPIDLKEWQRAKLLPVLDQPDRGYYMGVRRNKLDTRTRRSNPLTPFIPATPLLQWRIALMNERNDKAGAPKTHQLIYSFGNIPVFEMKSNDFTRQQAGLRKLAGGDIAGFLKCKAIPSKIRARVSLDTELPFTPAPSLLKPNARGLFKEMRDLRATGLNRYKNKTPANSMVAALIAAQALGTTMIEGKMQADPTVLGDHYLSRDEESGRMVARSAAMNAFDDIAPRLMNSNIKPLG